VIADSRAPRDGKFIERIGSYNPNTNPATIDFKFERALYWLQVGAQPTDTVKNILSAQGVLLKKHLLGGVKKGAFTEMDAETKFKAWLNTKQQSSKVEVSKLNEKERTAAKVKLEAEKATNKIKADALAVKKAASAAATAKARVEETETPVEAIAEAIVEIPSESAIEATTVTT
jgi:small subunit ribosomal protein S16